jgi:ABC-type transport system involved in multi-copper enzyme maturation permease subunit
MQQDKTQRGGWFSGFLAVLRYEFLWNLRKKKTVGLFILVFALATLIIFLRPLIDNYIGATFQQDPTFVITNVSSVNGIIIFLFAVATTMNTISGEFESGSILPLLTKPITKSTILVAKSLANFATLLGAYAVLGVYITIGGVLVYGPQNNLNLVPLGILGLTLATMVWCAIVLTVGTLTKNSLVAALGTFGIYIGLTIAGEVVASLLGATAILLYAPGQGAPASTANCLAGEGVRRSATSFTTGTDSLGQLLIQWVLNPNLLLNYCGINFRGVGSGTLTQLSSDLMSTVAARALGVAAVYLVALLFVSWIGFHRTQILE